MKMKRNLLIALALVLGLGFFAACKKNINEGESEVNSFQPNFIMAKTTSELKALQSDKNANLVRTLNDFDAAVPGTPLAKLTAKQLDEVRGSLVLRDGVGIVSLKYGPLEESLSYEDFAQVMGMFGLDIKKGYWGFSHDPEIVDQLSGSNSFTTSSSEVIDQEELPGTDYKGYYCKFPHDCDVAKNYICMSGC